MNKFWTSFSKDYVTDGSSFAPAKDLILEVYPDVQNTLNSMAIRREFSHIRQNAVLLGLPSPDLMTIAQYLALEEVNGEGNQIEYLDMKDLHVMSSSDMEIQFLLNRFIVKNMVGKSSLIVSNVECLATDHCDFKYFSNLLVQNSVVTYFDASFNAISRHVDFQIIFILPVTDGNQITRLKNLSRGTWLRREKSRINFLMDLMYYGGISYSQHVTLVPFNPIMKDSIPSITDTLLSQSFLQSLHVNASVIISDNVITSLVDEKYPFVHYGMVPSTSNLYLTYGSDELVLLLQRLIVVMKLHCPRDYNTTKTISLDMHDDLYTFTASTRSYTYTRAVVSASKLIRELMEGALAN